MVWIGNISYGGSSVQAKQSAQVRLIPGVQHLVGPNRMHYVGRLRGEGVLLQKHQVRGRLVLAPLRPLGLGRNHPLRLGGEGRGLPNQLHLAGNLRHLDGHQRDRHTHVCWNVLEDGLGLGLVHLAVKGNGDGDHLVVGGG